MRSDSWSKNKQMELELAYRNLFGGQIRVIKKLYRNKKDPDLLNELLTNVSINIFQILELNQLEQAEALIERMLLSFLEYDILVLKDSMLEEYTAFLSFFNDFHTIEFNEIRIKDIKSTKLLLEMILYIGLSYDYLVRHHTDAEENLNEYHLLEGFNADGLEYEEDISNKNKLIS